MVGYNQLNPMEVGAYVQEGFDKGRERGRSTYLNMLAGQAYSAAPDQRQGALAKLAGVDGRLAIDAGNAFTQQDRAAADFMHAQEKRKQEDLLNGAKLYLGAPEPMRPHVLSTIAPTLAKYGIDPSSATPEQLAQAAQAIVSAYGGGADGVPAGYREFDLLTQAAGTTPEDRARAARVRLGLEGRASNAGFGFDMVEDAYGNPRPQRRNPRDGSVEVFHAESQQWVPLGGAGPMPAGGPSPQPLGGSVVARDPQAVKGDIEALVRVFGGQITSAYRDPATNLRVGGVPNSQHMRGTGFDVVFPSPAAKQAAMAQARAMNYEAIDEGDHVHFELPPQGAQTGLTIAPPVTGSGAPPVLGVGRTKEEEAAAVERAKLGAQVDMAPQLADAAAAETRAVEDAKVASERAANAPKAAQTARDTIATLTQALEHPGRRAATGASAWFNPNNFLPGNPAKDFNVLMAQIKGKAFLQAFESLKGGGQITQVEGDKATAAMGRLETAQSEEAFESALNELKAIAQAALDRAEGRTTGGSGGAGNYQVGQVITLPDGRRVRITGLSDPNDPDVELVP